MEGGTAAADERARLALLDREDAEAVPLPVVAEALDLRLALVAREGVTREVAVDALVLVQRVQRVEIVVPPAAEA
jgi:hypothetical protein